MEFTCGIDDRPGLASLLIFGLQWLAVTVPIILIIGKVVAGLDTGGPAIPYLQKLFLLVALVMLAQIYLGHRLPLVLGPATVLLIGILASLDAGPGAINAATLIGGLLLAGLAATGLFRHLKDLFTPRVIAVVLMLIAFTLAPTILGLITDGGGAVPATQTFLFSLAFAFALFIANGILRGIWRSTLAFFAIAIGTPVYAVLFGRVPLPPADTALFAPRDLSRRLPSPAPGFCRVPDLLPRARHKRPVHRQVAFSAPTRGRPGELRWRHRPLATSPPPYGVIARCFSLFRVIAATGCARFALVPPLSRSASWPHAPAIGYLGSIPGRSSASSSPTSWPPR